MPLEFKSEKLANIGTSEPFMSRIALGLTEILGATSFDNRKDINDAILSILFEALTPAFISIQEIRKIETGETERVIINLDKNYTNLFDHLWVAYKDRMPKVAELMGFNIGFLFQNEKNFEEGSRKFLLEKNGVAGIDSYFIDLLRNHRDAWQNVLGTIRNDYLQHKKINQKEIEKYFTLEMAEIFFDNCWQAMEDILVILLRTGMPLYAGMDIAEVSKKRDPKAVQRFIFVSTR